MTKLHAILTSVFLVLFSSAVIFASGVKAQGLNETLLSTDNAYNPIASPDGKYIAYVRTGWGESVFTGFGRSSLVSEVKVVSTGGASVSRALDQNYFLSGWTPEGSHVVCFRDKRYELVSIDGKSGSKGRIPGDESTYSPSEWVAYAPSLDSIVWSRQIDSSHTAIETPSRTIVRENGFWMGRVVPSPDGRYLAVFGGTSNTNLRVYDLRLQKWTELGEMSIHPDNEWWYIQPNWNPWFADGSRLVFLRNSTLMISSPDGTEKTEIKVDGRAGLPVASPDGKSIAYVTFEHRPMNMRPDLQFWGGTTILVVPVSSRATPRAVSQKNPDEVYDLQWLDNDTLIFDRIADEAFYKQAHIWKVSVPR